jgi:dsRNA-specific ribonuclease
VGSRELGAGEGRSKKAAEQLAAEAAWETITAESGPPATPESAG